MEYDPKKSKVMVIGDPPTKPTFKIGYLTLEYTNKYKYLGEMFNNKWNLDDHIIEIKSKIEAAYQTILAVAQDRKFMGMEMEVIWKLYETCITPIITYAASTWNARKKDLNELNKILEGIIKRILITPITTPSEAFYLETGLLDVGHLESKEVLNHSSRIKNTPNS